MIILPPPPANDTSSFDEGFVEDEEDEEDPSAFVRDDDFKVFSEEDEGLLNLPYTPIGPELIPEEHVSPT